MILKLLGPPVILKVGTGLPVNVSDVHIHIVATLCYWCMVPKEGAWHNVSDLLENRQIDRPFSAE